MRNNLAGGLRPRPAFFLTPYSSHGHFDRSGPAFSCARFLSAGTRSGVLLAIARILRDEIVAPRKIDLPPVRTDSDRNHES